MSFVGQPALSLPNGLNLFLRPEHLLRFARRQIVLAGDDLAASLAFEFDAARWAILPPVLAAFLLAGRPTAASVSAIWRVESSAKAVKMSSASLM